MTGDGIFVCGYQNKNSERVQISNCNIYNNRRQGISVTSVDKINIYENEIHDIEGTWPQSGIDLEADDTQHLINNVKIYGNKFYEFKGKNAIICSKMVQNVEIYENEIKNSNIYVLDIKESCTIARNTMQNSNINIKKETNKTIKLIRIEQNNLQNSTIENNAAEDILILTNKIYGKILSENSNIAICNNEISFENNAIELTNNEENQEYYAYIVQNNINGVSNCKIQNSNDSIHLYTEESDLKEYFKKF